MAIRVFAHLSSQFPEYLLLIAGGGSETELIRLKELALELGVSKKIHFTEKQIAGVERVYTASDLVFSLTTRGEAFGRVPFEANACSAAVLAPSKGAALELIKDGENGFLADPLDQKAVEAKAIEILSDMERTQIIVRNAQNVFKPLLSPENSAKKVEEIYYKVLSHGY
jgi:glycosyltransferase involved in cell wall biosynthesis